MALAAPHSARERLRDIEAELRKCDSRQEAGEHARRALHGGSRDRRVEPSVNPRVAAFRALDVRGSSRKNEPERSRPNPSTGWGPSGGGVRPDRRNNGESVVFGHREQPHFTSGSKRRRDELSLPIAPREDGSSDAMQVAESGKAVAALEGVSPSVAPGVAPLSVGLTEGRSVRASSSAVASDATDGISAAAPPAKRPTLSMDEATAQRSKRLFGVMLGHLSKAKSTLESEPEKRKLALQLQQQEAAREHDRQRVVADKDAAVAETRAQRQEHARKREDLTAAAAKASAAVIAASGAAAVRGLKDTASRFLLTDTQPALFWRPAHVDSGFDRDLAAQQARIASSLDSRCEAWLSWLAGEEARIDAELRAKRGEKLSPLPGNAASPDVVAQASGYATAPATATTSALSTATAAQPQQPGAEATVASASLPIAEPPALGSPEVTPSETLPHASGIATAGTIIDPPAEGQAAVSEVETEVQPQPGAKSLDEDGDNFLDYGHD